MLCRTSLFITLYNPQAKNNNISYQIIEAVNQMLRGVKFIKLSLTLAVIQHVQTKGNSKYTHISLIKINKKTYTQHMKI